MPIRFLVVDDATFIRDMMKKQLRDGIPGCEVYDATDGARALSQLKKQRVDVVLSDWEMPNMSGEEFLRAMRDDEALAGIPFIMVTSRGDKDHVVKAIKSGVSDFITKPFTADELLKKTIKQLKKAGKDPKDSYKGAAQAGAGQGHGFGSIDVLTAGGSAPAKPAPKPAAKPAASGSAAALTGGAASTAPTDKKAAAKPAPKKKTQGRAQLRFPAGTFACVIRDMSLQAMSGLMQRGNGPLPTLFDQAVVDIGGDDGADVARVNGYISSIAAGENKVDTQIIKITVKFVDNDPEKFEVLSKYIAKTR